MGGSGAMGQDAEFWARARRHLMRYGGAFVDFVPVRAEGAFVCAAQGRRGLPAQALSDAVTDTALTLGLSANIVRAGASAGVMRIAPPLTVTEAEIDLGLALLGAAIEQTLARGA